MKAKILGHVLKAVLYIHMVFLGYLFFAFLLSILPQPFFSASDKNTGEIEIKVTTNQFHTDFLLPVAHSEQDWLSFFKEPEFVKYKDYPYVSFGWGDAAFFVESRHRDFPSMPTTLKTLFWPTDTFMHVTFHENFNYAPENYKTVKISLDQYRELIKFIEQSFYSVDSKPVNSEEKGYYGYDYFFIAERKYHLFKTCNNWTNRGLKQINVKTALWSPFYWGIFYHL